ncbi:MAG: hypothetical protein K6F80_04030 [Oscillospiraceae bacterium]|nr:hypothetical protein [Oscillospiraceae bacterium]
MTTMFRKLTALAAAGAMVLAQIPAFTQTTFAVDDNSSLFEGFDVPVPGDPLTESTDPTESAQTETPVSDSDPEIPDFSGLKIEGLTQEQVVFAAERIYRAIADPTMPEADKEGNLSRIVKLDEGSGTLFQVQNNSDSKDALRQALSNLFTTIVYTYREGLLVKPFPDYYTGISTLAEVPLLKEEELDGEDTELTTLQEVYCYNELAFSYLVNADQYASEYKKVNALFDTILNKANPNWSAAEKAVFFHDYLSIYCNYDYAVSKDYDDALKRWENTEQAAWKKALAEWEADGKIGDKPICPPSPDAFSFECFTARDMLSKRLGVCHAYAWLYNALMNESGVETFFVQSLNMNHSWNLVHIGEDYYHVDLTWDDQGMTRTLSGIQINHDPTLEEYKNEAGDWLTGYGNQVDHTHLLVSSAEMLKANERNESCYYYDSAKGEKIYFTDWLMTTGANTFGMAKSDAMTKGGFWSEALSAILPFKGGWVVKTYNDMNGYKTDDDEYLIHYLLYTYDAQTNTSRCTGQVATEGNMDDPWYRCISVGNGMREKPARNNYSVCCLDGDSVLYYTTRGGKELHFVVSKPNAQDYEINTLLNAEDYGFQEYGYILGMYIDGNVMRFQLAFTPYEPPVEKTLPLETIHEILRNRTSYAPFEPSAQTPSVTESAPAETAPAVTTTETTTTTSATTTQTTTTAATTTATESVTEATARGYDIISEGYLTDGGPVQMVDVVQMANYLSGAKQIRRQTVRARMDLDGNNYIDVYDLTLLKWRLINEK